jgi:hypothetical protein
MPIGAPPWHQEPGVQNWSCEARSSGSSSGSGLEYAEFSPPRNKAQYDKVRQAIERDDFARPMVLKTAKLTAASSGRRQKR